MPATYEPIATVTADGTTNPISFTSIPSTFDDLRIVISARANQGTTGAYSNATWRYNGSTTGYSNNYLYADGTSKGAATYTAQTYCFIPDIPYSGSTGNYNLITIDILEYKNTLQYKHALTTMSVNRASSGNLSRSIQMWRNTSAITSIAIDVDAFGGVSGRAFTAGSTFTLYGIKKA
jgi:hypothetical protein